MLRDGWKHPQKMPYFHDLFNLKNNILLFKVIHCDTVDAMSVHVYTATACKGMRRKIQTLFLLYRQHLTCSKPMFGGLCLESINIFFFHCLITHCPPKKKKKKKNASRPTYSYPVIPRPEDDKDTWARFFTHCSHLSMMEGLTNSLQEIKEVGWNSYSKPQNNWDLLPCVK